MEAIEQSALLSNVFLGASNGGLTDWVHGIYLVLGAAFRFLDIDLRVHK